jgi:hypothetical protein
VIRNSTVRRASAATSGNVPLILIAAILVMRIQWSWKLGPWNVTTKENVSEILDHQSAPMVRRAINAWFSLVRLQRTTARRPLCNVSMTIAVVAMLLSLMLLEIMKNALGVFLLIILAKVAANVKKDHFARLENAGRVVAVAATRIVSTQTIYTVWLNAWVQFPARQEYVEENVPALVVPRV